MPWTVHVQLPTRSSPAQRLSNGPESDAVPGGSLSHRLHLDGGEGHGVLPQLQL